VRDLPAAGRPVTLVWVKRVWRCMEPRCATRTWTETSRAIRPRASWTERGREPRRAAESASWGQTVNAVAAEFGVGWATVMAAVREYGQPLVDDPVRLDSVHTLGVDETAFLAAAPTSGTVFATGIVALNGRARLLDVVEGRNGNALSGWVSGRDQAWRDGITVAALDPFRGYATALRTSLPHATRVLDAFHVVRLGLDALDQIRRRVQHDTLGRRGHAGDPLFRIRRLLRRGHDHHTERSWARMLAGLDAGDPDEQVGRAWIAAQELRLLYRCPDRGRAERHLLRLFTEIAEHEIPELVRLAHTLDAWRDELLAYFDTGGVSNGPTEAVNGLIKKVKRVGLPQLRQLPTPPPPALRHRLEHSARHPDQRTATTLGCVEPANLAGHRAGKGLPSSRRHYRNVPRPIRRRVLGGCASRLFTASMALTVISAARLPLPSPTRAGL
jgi:transposase